MRDLMLRAWDVAKVVLVIVFPFVIYNAWGTWSCGAKIALMVRDSNPRVIGGSYGPIQGCMVHTAWGWTPIDNYRQLNK